MSCTKKTARFSGSSEIEKEIPRDERNNELERNNMTWNDAIMLDRRAFLNINLRPLRAKA